ncbi:MAG: M1 family metallopeptidase, partial [Gemmatimonadaceae bacterium]|nr:M1 family metallopeptidase [Chitinophagaceae bacterium]
MIKRLLVAGISIIAVTMVQAQQTRWQQHVKYAMDVNVDVQSNKFTGKQKLEYTNNSPDTLKKVFYHLYWNAFQPNSMMDARSRFFGKKVSNGRADWDARVKDRIQNLKQDEIGYQKVKWVKLNGADQKLIDHETILEVTLSKPLLPGGKAILEMEFEAQVPLQIRRSGRDNPSTGVRYSMSQWYPKLCEYDFEGWHPTPYISREFYGVWGDYDVKISIDKKYLVAGSGYLQNASQIGFGYEPPGTKVQQPAGDKLTWHFVAPNVHDFMWAADPDYKHISKAAANGTMIHVVYNRDVEKLKRQFDMLSASTKNSFNNDVNRYTENWDNQWQQVLDAALIALPFIEKNFGAYPYKQYSFVHGGDGGMEYPMATLVSGPGVGLAFHEWMHSWYQMILATNESLYAWMDEGFASFAETRVMDYYNAVKTTKSIPTEEGNSSKQKALIDSLVKANRAGNSHSGAYQGYFALVRSGLEEPMTTHADHFETNFGSAMAAYSKGEVFVEQLGYILGEEVRNQVLLEYYRQWKFKHPNVNDFIRVAEKVSGIQLDWYRDYFVNTTKTIDYGIDSVWEEAGKTKIRLINSGQMPMPVDLQVSYSDGSSDLHYVPMYLM